MDKASSTGSMLLDAWAVAPPRRIKTAALLFDRIWVPPEPDPMEQRALLPYARDWYQAFASDLPPAELCFSAKPIWDEYQMFVATKIYHGRGGGHGMIHYALEHLDIFAEAVREIRQVNALPVYESIDAFSRTYSSNNAIAYEAALINLEVVDEDSLTWGHVLGFRKDGEAVLKYRNLRLWLEHGLAATSLSHAVDVIAQSVEGYRWAITKHGFETRIGLISELFDHRTALTGAGAAMLGATAGGEVAAALASGFAIAGKLTAEVARREVERKSLRMTSPNKDIAIICEAQNLTK